MSAAVTSDNIIYAISVHIYQRTAFSIHSSLELYAKYVHIVLAVTTDLYEYYVF